MREPVQLPVTISQVPVHSTAPRHVIRVIRIREREAFEHAELASMRLSQEASVGV